MRTSTGKAPWHIIEGVDHAYRSLTVGTLLRDGLQRQIDRIELDRRLELELSHPDAPASKEAKKRKKHKPGSSAEQARAEGRSAGSAAPAVIADNSKGTRPLTVLSQLDMTLKLQKAEYSERLRILQAKLNGLHREARAKRISSILVFEGPDAAGKGGAIRRIAAALDARNYQVHGFSSPTDEERAQHYLWRFWRHLPRAGRISIFDRSWYGRVLVERVEGFASEDEWRRAYAEINDFEAQLVEHGVILVKYWIHISKEEQLNRFQLRERTPYKRWKLSDEDWRNRDKWDDYELAVNDMVQYTSTQLAPWTLVEGNDKRFARIKCLEVLCERMGSALTAAVAA